MPFCYLSFLCISHMGLFPTFCIFFPLVLSPASQSEDKVKPVLVVPGHLQALEHVVRQDYFPKESVAVLEAFMSR